MDETKKKDLKSYEAPETKKTQVELEEGVCAGSIDATAQSPGGAETTPQQVNTDFGNANDFSNGTWDGQ